MVKAGIEQTYKRPTSQSDEPAQNLGQPNQPEILPLNEIKQAEAELEYSKVLYPYSYSDLLERPYMLDKEHKL